MLLPATLYKEAITTEFQKWFYTDDMMYETGCMDNWIPNIIDCPGESQVQYAIVDKNKKLLGYLGYSVDWYASKAYNFGLFSFDRGNPIVGYDVFHELKKLVSTMHRVEWRAISGNPACRSYDRFIHKHGGAKYVLKDSIKDRSGNYRDDIIYEIVKAR